MSPADLPEKAGWRVILSAGLLCFVLGSVHAFSVFLVPLETTYAVSRGTVSLVYSFALITLTISVLIGSRFFHRFEPNMILLTSGLAAAAGTFITATAPSFTVVAIGYSLLFGAANGVGYGFGLQLAAQANPGREGLAMGIITACYATGAMLAPGLFVWALSLGGFQAAMFGLTGALVIAAIASGLIIRGTQARLQALPIETTDSQVSVRDIALLWLGYGTAVFSGLMVIGHAAEIARQAGLTGVIWLAPALIAGLNLVGSLLGGHMADRVSSRLLLSALPMLASVSLIGLLAGQSVAIIVFALACVGFCYGATIAIYPSIIAKMYGMANSPRIFGKVFTAWGAAGLLAPWLAGALFDAAGGYTIALAIAALFGLGSAAVVQVLFRWRSPHLKNHC
jgi:OFA family oxalate/formate antiporter-like MFS transporter